MRRLPQDVLREIFIFHKPRHVIDPRLCLAEDIMMLDLLRLCLVCREFREIAQPLLFRDLGIVENTRRSAHLLQILLDNDRLASYVVAFYVRIVDPLYDLNYLIHRRHEAAQWPTDQYVPAVIRRLDRLQELRFDRITIDTSLYSAICGAAMRVRKLAVEYCREIGQASQQAVVEAAVATRIEDFEVSEVNEIYKVSFPNIATAYSLKRLRISGNLLADTFELFRPLVPRKLEELSVFDLDTRETRWLIELLNIVTEVRVLTVQTYRGGRADESEDEGEDDHRAPPTDDVVHDWSLPLLSNLQDFTGEAWLCRILAPRRPLHRVALQSRVQNSVFGMSHSMRPMQVTSGQWEHEIRATVRAMKALMSSLAVVDRFECGVVRLDGAGLTTLMDNAATCLPNLRVLKLTWLYTGPTATHLDTIVPIHLPRLRSIEQLTISRKAFHVGNRPAEYVANLPWQCNLITRWHGISPSLRIVDVTPFVTWKLLNREWQAVFGLPELVKRLVRYWAEPARGDDVLISIVGATVQGHDAPLVRDYMTTIERLFTNDGDEMEVSVARLLGITA